MHVIMVEVETSCVANSGADLQWREFAVEGICTLPRAAVRSPGTNHPSCTPPALLKILSSASTFYVFECLPLSKEPQTWNIATNHVTIFHSPFSSFTLHPPLKALFGLKPFVAPARRNLSLHCVFSTVFDHGRLSTVFYAVFTAGTFQQCILYFIFCSEFPAQAFVFRASILCQIIFHSPCSK